MSDHREHGCQEYHDLSRRQFVTGAAGAAVMSAFLPEWLPKVVLAPSEDTTRDVIVNVFLRGGTDSLSLVAPYADPNYYAARPTIAIPRPDSSLATRGTALDNTFQFSRAMAGPLNSPGGMLPAYLAKQLLVVHGAGLSYNSRSHFDAQRFIEVGKAADTSISTGWLGRHLATTSSRTPGALLRGMAISSGLPQGLVGAPRTLPIPDPANFAIGGSAATRDARTAILAQDYFYDVEPARAAALDTVSTLALLRSINFTGYAPSNGAVYPTSSFGRAMRSAAALIKNDVGVEAIQIDIGGWDTHAQADPLAGSMFNTMRDLANSIGAFWADVLQGNGNYNVTLVAMSEFGRNVKENGDAGTDHGRGGAMFVMGKNIDGGRVLTQNWLPLAVENLQDKQDVKVTIDHRDILAELVQKRLGNPNLGLIFPSYTPTIRNITK
jgi:uncharacterized protein (DUF1501 family)